MKDGKKVLVLVPASTARGGISNYYQVLQNEFPGTIEYFMRGARDWPVRKGLFCELLRALQDYRLFKKRIANKDISLIQTSTSLGLATTIRDGLFVKCAQKKDIKTIVFFRGWDESAEGMVMKYFSLFKYFFFNANKLITLSETAKEKLKQWGYKGDIYVETTVVDKNLLNGVNETSIIDKYGELNKNGRLINLLFLSRVEERKGIFELLDAYESLNQISIQTNYFSLTICGDGFEIEKVKRIVKMRGLKNVSVNGFVSGIQKKEAFEEAHLFLFPSHGEGMPNAVLEAMGFGLPIITTAVGGIIDFFIPGKHGFYIKQNDPYDIVYQVNRVISDKQLLLEIALNNYKLANDRFRSDKVAERIQEIFINTISN
jgi:glycosyltransferase involved in cell wall biosynthesis